MKKIVSMLLLAALLFGACVCVQAYPDHYTVINYDFENSDWPQGFWAFPGVEMQMRIADGMEYCELNEANIEHGIFAVFMNEYGEHVVLKQSWEYDYLDQEAVHTPEQLCSALIEKGMEISDIEPAVLNGLPCLLYTDTENDERNVGVCLGDGYVITVNFSHAASHPDFIKKTNEMIPSIMPYYGE